MNKLNNELMRMPLAAQICHRIVDLNNFYTRGLVFQELKSPGSNIELQLHIDNLINTYPANIIQDCIKIMFPQELKKVG